MQIVLPLTDEMIDAQLKLIADCVDADVTFQPSDPKANRYLRQSTRLMSICHGRWVMWLSM